MRSRKEREDEDCIYGNTGFFGGTVKGIDLSRTYSYGGSDTAG